MGRARRIAQQGFTLVEMAIVLVIIGLIVGGILKGQEIVNNGRVKTQVAQVDAVKAAVNTFVDRFNFFPGDFSGAESVFGTDATFNGNGDGVIGAGIANAQDTPTADTGATIPKEMELVWVQMQAANLISSVPSTATYAQNSQYYEGKLPTAFLWFGDWQWGVGAASVTNKMVMLEGSKKASTVPSPGARMSDALSIDTKYDDGLPATGQILAGTASSANNCCKGTACAPALAGTATNTYGLNPGGVGAAGSSGSASCVILWQIE
jgi:prepilin-type N-terminal cleavage/methylation domain-containing protein